jgi:hypothetical protein
LSTQGSSRSTALGLGLCTTNVPLTSIGVQQGWQCSMAGLQHKRDAFSRLSKGHTARLSQFFAGSTTYAVERLHAGLNCDQRRNACLSTRQDDRR